MPAKLHYSPTLLSWENMIIYGAISPLWFDKGEERVAQRAEGTEQRGSDDAGSFTQVRAAGGVTPYSCLGLYCVLSSGARRTIVLIASSTERESDRSSELPYVAHGPPFIGQRGNRQVATQSRVKM